LRNPSGDGLRARNNPLMLTRRIGETGSSLREIHYWKSGKHQPKGDRYSRIIAACARYSREKLEETHAPFIPSEDIPAIRLYAQSIIGR
jgi:hypothetical protein